MLSVLSRLHSVAVALCCGRALVRLKRSPGSDPREGESAEGEDGNADRQRVGGAVVKLGDGAAENSSTYGRKCAE
jgi:hypothetical protein